MTTIAIRECVRKTPAALPLFGEAVLSSLIRALALSTKLRPDAGVIRLIALRLNVGRP